MCVLRFMGFGVLCRDVLGDLGCVVVYSSSSSKVGSGCG